MPIVQQSALFSSTPPFLMLPAPKRPPIAGLLPAPKIAGLLPPPKIAVTQDSGQHGRIHGFAPTEMVDGFETHGRGHRAAPTEIADGFETHGQGHRPAPTEIADGFETHGQGHRPAPTEIADGLGSQDSGLATRPSKRVVTPEIPPTPENLARTAENFDDLLRKIGPLVTMADAHAVVARHERTFREKQAARQIEHERRMMALNAWWDRFMAESDPDKRRVMIQERWERIEAAVHS